MFGSIHPGFRLDPDVREAVAEKKLSEVSEKYGLDLEDVNVEFDSSLPYNVLGRTSAPRYSGDNITVSVSDKFFEMDEEQQYKTMLHEGIHVKQFQDDIDEWLKNEFNASEDFIREVEKSSDPLYEKDIEGITEVLTDTILPFDVGTGYPYEKRRKEAELEAKGFDVESELVQDIGDELDKMIENYKQVYSSFEVGDFYLEQGGFSGIDYTAVIFGYEDGEDVVNEYLASIEDGEKFSTGLEPADNSEGKLYAI